MTEDETFNRLKRPAFEEMRRKLNGVRMHNPVTFRAEYPKSYEVFANCHGWTVNELNEELWRVMNYDIMVCNEWGN